jgi:membrane associated rhomboid family serine protease
MIEQSLVTLLLVVVTCVISYKGFNNSVLREAYAFDVDRIMIGKDYVRLISSGFLHTGWTHLIFNMIALYLFGSTLEPSIGGIKILLIYFTSLVGGNLMALLIHKNHGDYTSVGASGAVNGIVFSSIALFPDGGIVYPFFNLWYKSKMG